MFRLMRLDVGWAIYEYADTGNLIPLIIKIGLNREISLRTILSIIR